MKGATLIRRVAVCLAVVGFCFPQIALAATPQNAKTLITDVRLVDSPEGPVLLGMVVTPENTAVANTNVALYSANQKLCEGKTNAEGYFAFSKLSSQGVYQVAAAEGQGTYRVWTEKTAPPSAKSGVVVVAGQTVRGQSGMHGLRNFFANPLVIAGIVATAIAVPVAIHNSRGHSG